MRFNIACVSQFQPYQQRLNHTVSLFHRHRVINVFFLSLLQTYKCNSIMVSLLRIPTNNTYGLQPIQTLLVPCIILWEARVKVAHMYATAALYFPVSPSQPLSFSLTAETVTLALTDRNWLKKTQIHSLKQLKVYLGFTHLFKQIAFFTCCNASVLSPPLLTRLFLSRPIFSLIKLVFIFISSSALLGIMETDCYIYNGCFKQAMPIVLT